MQGKYFRDNNQKLHGKYWSKKGNAPLFFRFVDFWKSSVNRAVMSAVFAAVFLTGGFFVWATIDGSVAWFSKNESVEANGIHVVVDQMDPLEATVSVHAVTGLDDGVLSFNSSPMDPADQYPMPKYDILDSVNRHILLRIALPREYPMLNLKLSTATNYFMDGETHPLLGGDGKGETYNNNMTSIVKFALVNATESESSYNVTIPETYHSFVQNRDTDPSVTPANINLATNTTAEVFYVLISYDAEMIERIYSENIGNPVTGGVVGGNGQDNGDGQINTSGQVNYVMDFKFSLDNGLILPEPTTEPAP